VAVIEQLVAALPTGEDPALGPALKWYQELPLEQRIKLRLFAPAAETEFAPLPMTSRALRNSIAVGDLIEHFEAMVADGKPLGVTPSTSLPVLADQLASAEVHELWQAWRERFPTADGLTGTLTLFQDEWAPLRPGLIGVLLVLDQFEEMFTRLLPGATDNLMAHAERLCLRRQPDGAAKPVNLAFSLRKEFFADLVPRMRPFGSAERLTFFLGPMPLTRLAMYCNRPRSSALRSPTPQPAPVTSTEFCAHHGRWAGRRARRMSENDDSPAHRQTAARRR
jgi:hypothetical protein